MTQTDQDFVSQPKKTVLYDRHLALAGQSRLAPFAGYLLPLWYSGIPAEHKAVRTAAGLFDVTHMCVLGIAGPAALPFLDYLTTNSVAALTPGRAQYSYILDDHGHVLDDIIVYCLAPSRYMVVVNAANTQKIKAWSAQVLNTQTDLFSPGSVTVLDIRHESPGRVDLALQGPASLFALFRLIPSEYHLRLESLKTFELLHVDSPQIDLIIARTGYTGEKIAFELFVDPSKAPWLWDTLLDLCRDLNVIPCGLGARDSLRIEAGLPLYGHELDGPDLISPYQAGYPWAVKLNKPEFIGKTAIAAHAASFRSQIVRLSFPGEKGIRPIRPGDAVLDKFNTCIGHVTSSAGIHDTQIALALVLSGKIEVDQPIALYYASRNAAQTQLGRLPRPEQNMKLEPDLKGLVLPRFAKF